MLAAIITNDLETRRRIRTLYDLFGAAFRTPLRCHHVSLIKGLLILFTKNEDIFALNTRDLDIGHKHHLQSAKLTVIEVILSHCKKFPLTPLRNFAIRANAIYI